MGAEVRENVDTLFNPPGAVHLGILPSWEGFLEAYRVIDRIRLMDDASDRQSEPIRARYRHDVGDCEAPSVRDPAD